MESPLECAEGQAPKPHRGQAASAAIILFARGVTVRTDGPTDCRMPFRNGKATAMASNEKCHCGSGRKRRYCCDKAKKVSVRVNVAKSESVVAIATRNILSNLVTRDISPVCISFDQHYAERIRPIDELFSDAAFILFTTTRYDGNISEDYESVLYGLLNNALNSIGSATVLLRSGFYKQALTLMRQAIEIASTVIHIVGDDSGKALAEFKDNTYVSSKSITKAKAAIPVIGELWGFLSNSYVHITSMYAFVQTLRPYTEEQQVVIDAIDCLRMSTWIVYLAAEIAFPMTLSENRYWKPLVVGNRHALAFNPNREEREWAANYLDKEGLTADDIAAADKDVGLGNAEDRQ